MRTTLAVLVLTMAPGLLSAQETKRYYATFHSCYDGDTCFFDFNLLVVHKKLLTRGAVRG